MFKEKLRKQLGEEELEVPFPPAVQMASQKSFQPLAAETSKDSLCLPRQATNHRAPGLAFLRVSTWARSLPLPVQG